MKTRRIDVRIEEQKRDASSCTTGKWVISSVGRGRDGYIYIYIYIREDGSKSSRCGCILCMLKESLPNLDCERTVQSFYIFYIHTYIYI